MGLIEIVSYPSEIVPGVQFTITFIVQSDLLAPFGSDGVLIISDEVSDERTRCDLIGGEAPVLICNKVTTYCYQDSKYENSSEKPFYKYKKEMSLNINKEITECSGDLKIIIQHFEWFIIFPLLLGRSVIIYTKQNGTFKFKEKQ